MDLKKLTVIVGLLATFAAGGTALLKIAFDFGRSEATLNGVVVDQSELKDFVKTEFTEVKKELKSQKQCYDTLNERLINIDANIRMLRVTVQREREQTSYIGQNTIQGALNDGKKTN